MIQSLVQLINIDAKKTSMVIFYHMYSYIPLVITKLDEKRAHLYPFLKHALEYKESGSQPASPVHQANQASYVDPLLSKETLDLYIDLMCEFEPRKVAAYLKSRSNYDLHKVLEICEKFSVLDAQAYLLEKDGRTEEAFDLIMSQLDEKLRLVPDTTNPRKKPEQRSLFWTQINASVMLIVQLCQRSCSETPPQQKERFWFQLLDALLSTQNGIMTSAAASDQDAAAAADNVNAIKDVVKHVVNSAIGYVPLRSVIEKILKDPAYQTGSFGDVKGFLVEMLELYHYEETLLRSTVRLVQDDLHCQTRARQKEARKGFRASDLKCDLCRSHLALHGGQSIVFQCAHKFHLACLDSAGCGLVSRLGGDESWHCYACISAKSQGAKDFIHASDGSVQKLPKKNHKKVMLGGGRGLDEDVLKQITDQRLVKAKVYLEHFKSSRSPLAIQEQMSEERNDDQDFLGENVAFYQRPDFPLKLWPESHNSNSNNNHHHNSAAVKCPSDWN